MISGQEEGWKEEDKSPGGRLCCLSPVVLVPRVCLLRGLCVVISSQQMIHVVVDGALCSNPQTVLSRSISLSSHHYNASGKCDTLLQVSGFGNKTQHRVIEIPC